MKVLKILTAPNPLLEGPSKKVLRIDEKIKKLVADMEATLKVQTDPQGVGLAAVQIGIPLQLFIMKQNPKAKTQVFINPKLLKNEIETGDGKASQDAQVAGDQGKRVTGSVQTLASTGGRETDGRTRPDKPSTKSSLEGCLSVPRIWSPIKRAKKIALSYQDINGEIKKNQFGGLAATIVQHELDHLAGILFTRQALLQKSTLYEEINGKLKKMKY